MHSAWRPVTNTHIPDITALLTPHFILISELGFIFYFYFFIDALETEGTAELMKFLVTSKTSRFHPHELLFGGNSISDAPHALDNARTS